METFMARFDTLPFIIHKSRGRINSDFVIFPKAGEPLFLNNL